MSVKVKPIQPTPVLSGIDAKRIIEEVKRVPSKETIEKKMAFAEKVRKALNK